MSEPLFDLKHDKSDYLVVSLKLWSLKLLARIVRQRKYLTILLSVSLAAFYIVNRRQALLFLAVILLVLIVDLGVTIANALSDIRSTKSYKASGGENVQIYTGDYFCFVNRGEEYRKMDWADLNEYCRIPEPQAIAFKDRRRKDKYILYASELGKKNFLAVRELIESKMSVVPLV